MEAGVDALVRQGLGGGVCFEVLDLSSDAGAWVGEGGRLSLVVAVEGPDARVVVLTREDDAAVLEEAGLLEALGEGDVATDALGLAFLQEYFGELFQGAARELRGRVMPRS